MELTELPSKIRMLSDHTELEFVEKAFFEKKKTTDKIGKYKYIKAKVLFGEIIILSLEQINYLHGCRLLEVIKQTK